MQAKRRVSGRPAEDDDRYSAWREDADPDNLALLGFYGRYLVGQYAGMGSALDLDALRAACDLEGVTAEDRPELVSRVLYLHGLIVEATKRD